ncbi:MAG: PbsX family transcriptional regulator [Burkholderiales bacterium]|nr:PbsX family transcriptional regulator [Burkholderiales bacterium]
MNTAIRKSGQSEAIAPPQPATVIEPTAEVAYSLPELVAGISPRNLHREVDFGAPAGKEAT